MPSILASRHFHAVLSTACWSSSPESSGTAWHITDVFTLLDEPSGDLQTQTRYRGLSAKFSVQKAHELRATLRFHGTILHENLHKTLYADCAT
jgi:hypothetical protein